MCWRWQPARAQPHGWFMGCCWLQINHCRNRPFASTALYIQNMMDYSAKSRCAHVWVLGMPSVWWTEIVCSISVTLWLHNSEQVSPNGLFWIIIIIVNHTVNKKTSSTDWWLFPFLCSIDISSIFICFFPRYYLPPEALEADVLLRNHDNTTT